MKYKSFKIFLLREQNRDEYMKLFIEKHYIKKYYEEVIKNNNDDKSYQNVKDELYEKIINVYDKDSIIVKSGTIINNDEEFYDLYSVIK